MNAFKGIKPEEIFSEYLQRKDAVDTFKEDANTRIRKMAEIANEVVNAKILEYAYDARITPVKYQELLNRIYDAIEIAKKHPCDPICSLSLSNSEGVVCCSTTARSVKTVFSVSYEELIMTDRVYKSHLNKTVKKIEKEVLASQGCLCMQDVSVIQSMMDKEKEILALFTQYDKKVSAV